MKAELPVQKPMEAHATAAKKAMGGASDHLRTGMASPLHWMVAVLNEPPGRHAGCSFWHSHERGSHPCETANATVASFTERACWPIAEATRVGGQSRLRSSLQGVRMPPKPWRRPTSEMRWTASALEQDAELARSFNLERSMHELLERLGRGDSAILDMCARADQAWTAFFVELHTADVGTLSARLGFFQPIIVKIFDSPSLGESMMAWTAFANLYDTKAGWGPNEQRVMELVTAFGRSNCSAEVKAEAQSAVISYELNQHPNFPREFAPERSNRKDR